MALKKRIFIPMMGMSIFLAAGCGSSGSSDTPGKPAAGETPAKVTTLVIGGTEYLYSRQAAEKFDQAHPDIELKLEYGKVGVDDGTAQALLSSGQGPDVMVTGSGPSRINVLAGNKLIRPIDDIYKKLNLGERYLPHIMEQITKKDGSIYEIVEGTDVFQVYYHKSMFEALNIKTPPQTWEEFLAICETLKKAGIQPIAAGFRDVGVGWFGGLIMESAAGKDRMAKVIFGEASFADEPFRRGYEMLRELVQKGYIDGQEALALGNSEAAAGYYNEQYGMFATANAVLLNAAKDSGIDTSKYGAFPLPSVEKERRGYPTAGIAHSWVVNANIAAEKLPALEKWLDYVSSGDYIGTALGNGGILIPAVSKVPPGITMNSVLKDSIQKVEGGAGFNPSVYFPSSKLWFESLQGVIGGTMTPEEAVQSIDQSFKNKK